MGDVSERRRWTQLIGGLRISYVMEQDRRGRTSAVVLQAA